MRAILSERNLVVVLFIMVMVTFALAHEDSKKMEQIYVGNKSSAGSSLVSTPSKEIKKAKVVDKMNIQVNPTP